MLHNVKFQGNVGLLEFILKKYKDELPYKGYISRFARDILYTEKGYKNWSRTGINPRIWNLLHKDLVMARLMGRIRDEDVMSLESLKKEYQQHQSTSD